MGQSLKLPVKKTTEENIYIVKNGDSLYKIAQEFNTTVNKLMDLNDLTSTTLRIGQILKIPYDNIVTSAEKTYTVKNGDSLYKIAQKFNTTVNELKRLNNLNSTLLSIGQVLRVKENL